MALTPSNMLPIGTEAPHFKLLDVTSNTIKSLDELKGKNGTFLGFICNHCPFVIHLNKELVNIANDYKTKGINTIMISSNDVETYPQDGPDKMVIHAQDNNYPFPYLYDESQEIAKAYAAACTPDFYIFNDALTLIYRGQLDNSRPENGIPATGEDLRHALDALLSNKKNEKPQKPSIGCNIKWKIEKTIG